MELAQSSISRPSWTLKTFRLIIKLQVIQVSGEIVNFKLIKCTQWLWSLHTFEAILRQYLPPFSLSLSLSLLQHVTHASEQNMKQNQQAISTGEHCNFLLLNLKSNKFKQIHPFTYRSKNVGGWWTEPPRLSLQINFSGTIIWDSLLNRLKDFWTLRFAQRDQKAHGKK